MLAGVVAARDAETKRAFQKWPTSIPRKLLASLSPTVDCALWTAHCGLCCGSHLPSTEKDGCELGADKVPGAGVQAPGWMGTRSGAGGFLTLKRTEPEATSQIWK